MSDYFTIKTPISRSLSIQTPVLVDPGSLLRLRRNVETIAYYFRREFDYDFVQFEARETPGSLGFVPYEAWLFHEKATDQWRGEGDNPRRIVGAACFRKRDEADGPPEWSLQWVWLHPFRRRRGLLRAAWPTFEKRYHDFLVERPLSEAMSAFLKSARSTA